VSFLGIIVAVQVGATDLECAVVNAVAAAEVLRAQCGGGVANDGEPVRGGIVVAEVVAVAKWAVVVVVQAVVGCLGCCCWAVVAVVGGADVDVVVSDHHLVMDACVGAAAVVDWGVAVSSC
jgi:hypothetical protein